MRKLLFGVVFTVVGILFLGVGSAAADQPSGSKQVVAGEEHSCALARTGEVNCWGRNSSGQLGDGTTTSTNLPAVVQAVDGDGELTNVKQITAGSNHTCALLTDGRVNCWGNNFRGQLGNGTETNSTAPVVVQAVGGSGELTNVKQIAAGGYHTCALLRNGRVNCWGYNLSGELGNGTDIGSAVPVVVQSVGGGGELTRVKQITGGFSHTCAVLTSGRVNCWGNNINGQLGDDTKQDSNTPVVVQAVGGGGELVRVKQVTGGSFHTCAVLTNGHVNCWGKNSYGQLGNGTNSSSETPVVVQAVGGGGELANVKQVVAGFFHTCALTRTGQVNCWGYNARGGLGDGTNNNSDTPVVVQTVGGGSELVKVKQLDAGFSHTCAVVADRRATCWGRNTSGQLGNGTQTDSNTPVLVRGIGEIALSNVKQVSVGSVHTCAVLRNGRVNCWGGNGAGQFGDGTNTDSNTPVVAKAVGGRGELTRVKQVAAGNSYSCALLANGRVNCWGANELGVLGDGTNTASNTPVVVKAAGGTGQLTKVKQITAGGSHMCALLTNGRVNCWGSNGFGQLGDGTNIDSNTPVFVQAADGGGDLAKVKQIAAGNQYTCALLTNGRVNCWGRNTGQLGDGTIIDSSTPVVVQAVGGGGELTNVKQVAPFGGHACALLTDGRVNCWGLNRSGELGDGTTTSSTTPVVVQGIGGVGELTDVKQLAPSSGRTCALLTDGRVNCWGGNRRGGLGDGTNTPSNTPVVVQEVGGGGELAKVKQIASGARHSCALLTDGRVNCWGDNPFGGLGDSTRTESNTPVVVVAPL